MIVLGCLGVRFRRYAFNLGELKRLENFGNSRFGIAIIIRTSFTNRPALDRPEVSGCPTPARGGGPTSAT